MNQKLMILTVMLLGLASCSTPKKAIYVEPVISAKNFDSETCKETLSDKVSINSFITVK